MLKPLLALALLLPCTPTAAPEELRIPAATGYLIPDPDAVPVSSARPIRPFVATGAGIAWFGDFGKAGELEVAVAIKADRGDTLRLHLSVGSSRLEAVMVGTGEEVRVALGRVTLPATGYHRFLLTADGRRPAAAEVRALLLDGAPLPQAHFNLDPRRNAASVHLRFPVDTGAVVTGFYNEVTAVDDPVTTYYMATGFARGYFGMQVNSPTERRIIFSVWDAASGTNAKDRSTVASENYTQLMAKGDGVVAEVFGNEGTGGHSHLVYPWKTGSRQRFFVTAQLEGDATIYSGYWFHPDKQAWVLIASFRAAKDGQGLRRLYAFSENFGGSTGHLRRKALFGPQWIRLANGQWQELTTATFSHDATGKENRGDRFMGVEEGRFFLSHGGFVPGWTTSGASFTRAATGVPPVIDLPAEEVPFRVSRSGWDAEVLGNHRAVVRVATTGDAARVTIPWRRRDDHPEAKRIVVVDSASGRRIGNVRTDAINRERGELIFEPTSGAGRYDVYYLPFKSGGRSNYPNITYLPPDSTADAAWLRAIAERRAMPRAAVEAIEAVDTLSSFFPMEVIATAAETERVRRDHAGDGFLLFPEDRLYPIRMTKDLPARWVLQPPGDSLVGRAARGEYFAFQLGLYALRRQDSVTVRFSDLRGPTGAIIPAARLNSLNTGGVDWAGRPMTKRVDVAAGMVQALWCGVDVPLGARPGRYRGRATVRGSDGGERTVQLVLDVAAATAVRGGADEPWKQTRLAWLNSTLAQRNDVIAPYTPLVVRGDTVSLLGRRLVVGRSGLPAGIATYFTEEMTGFSTRPKAVLAAPIEFVVDGGGAGTSSGARFDRREPGTVGWHATTTAPGWTMQVQGALEFDGYLSYRIALVARTALSLADIRMVVPFAPGAAKYMMGLGQKGGRRPASLDWRWEVATKNQDGAWIGDVNAGLYFSLRGDNYVRPLNTNFYLQKPLNLPPSWGNGGAGGITVRETAGAVRVTSFSGPRTLAAGDTLWFDVVGLITPFHPIDTDFQWSHRFYHRYAPVDTVLATSANVVNIHHANAINPYINYPFIAHDAMRAYIDSAHARGLTVKIYDTVRELSNRAWEIFPMRSLGHEIFTPGKGGGSSWPQEHLVDDYIAGWYVPELKDAAIINSGMSRWHNYYIEGVSWLVRTVGIDGLYLDDVAFDRVTMKRLKRVLVQDGHPGIIDLHSANQYNKNDGFINSGVLYLEHFPYLNRLWFGEYFDYEKNSADFYLTEVSGIPFGLMGEMLQDGGNPWRGMLYGMTNRMPWDKNADPRPIWALWDRVGMQGTKMIGYWVASTPVRTGREDVLATVYRKPGQALVAVASWANGPVALRLQIDWKALGIDSTRATITAPAVGTLQAEQHYRPGEAIPIQPGKGAFLVVK